jgi:hypothetical protein
MFLRASARPVDYLNISSTACAPMCCCLQPSKEQLRIPSIHSNQAAIMSSRYSKPSNASCRDNIEKNCENTNSRRTLKKMTPPSNDSMHHQEWKNAWTESPKAFCMLRADIKKIKMLSYKEST